MDPPAGPSLGNYDLVVIGGGSGGLAVAKGAAILRKKVLILDLVAPSPKGSTQVFGGSSLNADSIKKHLHQATLLGKAIQDSQKYGWKIKDDVCPVWSELVEAVQTQMKSHSLELKRELKRCGRFYLNAHGEIVAPHTVEVTDMNGQKRTLSAETLVIATGDRPEYLDIPGDREYCLTSEDLLSVPHPPGRTLVVGGSPQGLEYAGFLSGLGLPVTIIPTHGLLPGFDQKMAQKIENHMLVSGVTFLHHCSLTQVEQSEVCSTDTASGVSAALQQNCRKRLSLTILTKEGQTKQEDFDTVLLTVGRKACTCDVGLERVGVQCSSDGRILVDDRDQTSVDHIYTVGSVQHGHPSTTGLSMHAGTLLAR